MKKTFIFATILLAALTLDSCDLGSSPIKALADIDGVHHVNIPNWLINVTGANNEMIKDLDDISMSGISNLRIYAADDEAAATALYDKARKVAQNNGFELALKASDEGDKADIYIKHDGKRAQLMIVGADADGETAVVSLSAKISESDLAKLLTPNT